MKTILTALFAIVTSLAALSCVHAGGPDVLVDPEPPTGERVNLNTATERDLIELPGIGPTKASAIVAYRTKHGPFAKIEDLNKVKGFGRKTVAKLRPSLTLMPTSSPQAKKEDRPLAIP